LTFTMMLSKNSANIHPILNSVDLEDGSTPPLSARSLA
jgi:hypothetical protein